ncbi:hemolysin III family protein [Shewanella sp. C32]|uniref:Hemolysin III family protein n=1 Tax=Shewanella electrica TaxID=515560 RepID=A0ABT2FM07_9GAMM|nr:hemolysin III family protein [Shewanella electrica]MCH1923813.1 hemolysin III family protein [Shewanella electrica]MCS4557031.1 hemolysin III family protein [Shewanella electrica]
MSNYASTAVYTSDYSAPEEWINSITHGIGVVFGIVGLVLMLSKGAASLTTIQLTGVSLYGGSFILLFLCSTLYHSVPTLHWKRRLKILDHCAIYLLIAGTYTPLMLIALANSDAEWVLIAIWALAASGVLFKSFFVHRFKFFSLCLYLTMGWLCMAVLPELVSNLSVAGFWLLVAGGLSYSLGVPFYAIKRIPYNHAIWHLFVLGGAVCHFLCIYLTVIPAK